MNKKVLQKINNLAKFIFDEEGFHKLMSLIVNDKFNDARLFIDDQLQELEVLLGLTDNDEGLLNQYKQCDELIDIVIDMINKKEDAYGKGEQVRLTA